MKRIIICICILLLLLTGCFKRPVQEYTAITPIGTVPKEFQTIIENNLFHTAVAFENRLLKQTQTDEGYTVSMYDYHGNLQASYSRNINTRTYRIACMIATADNGYLVTFGFSDHFDSDTNSWASESGVDSFVVKLDAQGNVQWEQRLKDYTANMLSNCFEREDGYYFIGEQETPETNVVGIGSPTDLHFMKMSKVGEILVTKIIGGSDYDSVSIVDNEGDQFILYCRIQSTNGDFAERNTVGGYNYKLIVNDAFQLLSMESFDLLFPHNKIGRINEKTIYSNHDSFAKFDAGTPTAVMDYGDFYLIVSENITGVYENTPAFISSIWYYTETVYSVYNKNEKLLWRIATDSSLDYDSQVKNMMNTDTAK